MATSSEGSGQEVVKDQELWFDDGSIIIVASKTIAFRVYRGLLSRVSSVFHDMFSFGKPDGETMEGCPVVHVSDPPMQLRHFLRAVYIANTESAFPPFSTLASIIRIGHKYQAQDVVHAATSRLERFLIPSPGHWIDFPAPWKDRWDLGLKQCGISIDITDAIEAVNLARLLEKPPMLPVALYLCCLGSVLSLRNGVKRADGTVESLSDEDFEKCATALPVLARECHAVIRRSLDKFSAARVPACGLSGNCQRVVANMLSEHVKDESACPPSDLLVLPLHRVVPPVAYARGRGSLCPTCEQELQEQFTAAAISARERLPQYFSLELGRRK